MTEDLFRVGLNFGPVEVPIEKPAEDKEPDPKEGEDSFVDDDFFKEFSPVMTGDKKEEPKKEEPKKEVEEPEEKPEDVEEEKPEEVPEKTPELSPSMFIYNFLRENDIVPEVENFKDDPENLRELLRTLPEVYINQALDTIHEDSKVLLQYAYNLGTNADIAALKAFFDEYYEPQLTEFDITTDEGARAYLADMFRRKKVYDSSEDINNALDMLADQDKIKLYAQNKYTAEKEELDKQAEARAAKEKEASKTRQLAAETRQKEIISELHSLEWTDQRKMKVAQNLNPQIASKKTQAIMASPKAIIQLADFYTYFDEKKKMFDIDAMVKAKAESLGTEKTKKKVEKDSFSSTLSRLKPGVQPKTDTREKVIMPMVDLSDENTVKKIFNK